MRRAKILATACATAAMVALGISATAQDLNPLEKTFLTFSAPVELPGVTLPAGTYVFKLADTAGRNVVQVTNQDGSDVLGQFLFVQASRPDVSGETVVTFREMRENAMPAIQYWYYPGEKIGKEFIYPKAQALQIAARTGATVRSDDGEVTAPATVAEVQIQPQPEPVAAVIEGPGLPPAPQVEVAQVEVEPQPVGTSGQLESQSAQNELPRTASPLALSGLLGLLSLAGAAGVRFFRA